MSEPKSASEVPDSIPFNVIPAIPPNIVAMAGYNLPEESTRAWFPQVAELPTVVREAMRQDCIAQVEKSSAISSLMRMLRGGVEAYYYPHPACDLKYLRKYIDGSEAWITLSVVWLAEPVFFSTVNFTYKEGGTEAPENLINLEAYRSHTRALLIGIDHYCHDCKRPEAIAFAIDKDYATAPFDSHVELGAIELTEEEKKMTTVLGGLGLKYLGVNGGTPPNWFSVLMESALPDSLPAMARGLNLDRG